MSELSDFQKEVGEWGDETFNSKREHDTESCARGMFNHLTKETLELGQSLMHLYHSGGNIEDVAEESADCLLILLHLSHLHEFDLVDEGRKKMRENYRRTESDEWGKPDKDGVIEHIRPESKPQLPPDTDGEGL